MEIGFTLGFKESYDKYLSEPGPHIKIGKGSFVEGYKDYPGGTVWRTKEEAEDCKKHNPGYEVYSLLLPNGWEEDAYLTKDGLYSINKDCVILSRED